MKQYLDHSLRVLSDKNTIYKPNRTGVDSLSRFGGQTEYDLSDGFPLVTTKKVPFKHVAIELLWFLNGDTNIRTLVNKGVHIWDDNAFYHHLKRNGRNTQVLPYTQQWTDEKAAFIDRIKNDDDFARSEGNLGDVYGRQWRAWTGPNGQNVDQITKVINSLRNSPSSRRHIVSAWNVPEIDSMALPPCHSFFQFNVAEDKLDCEMYQRSADMFLGVPFNVASYALLTHIIAQQTGLKPGRFVHSFGDAHFYCGRGERGRWYGSNLEEVKEGVKEKDFSALKELIEREAPAEEKLEAGLDHVTGILEQLSREPKKLPRLAIANKRLEDLTVDDFELFGYNPSPSIKRTMAV